MTALLLLYCGAPHLRAANHTWTGGGGNALWSNNANWSGGKPVSGESGGTIVIFGSGTTTTCDIAGLIVNQVRFTGGGNTINGTTALTINGGLPGVHVLSNSGTNTLAASLPLIYSAAQCRVEVTAGSLTLAGNISGGVSMRKLGAGTLTITGNTSYAGITNVDDGTLSLNSNGLNTGVPGAVTVGDGTGAGGSAVLVLQQNTEIPDTATVTVRSDGKFDMNDSLETIGMLAVNGGVVLTNGSGAGHLLVANAASVTDGAINIGSGKLTLYGTLTMAGGIIVSTSSGMLTLGGDVTATAGGTIAGNIRMNGTRTFTVNSGAAQPELTVNSIITEGTAGSGLKKSGTGTLRLLAMGGNTYTGTTVVDKGRMQIDGYSCIPGALTIGNDNDDPGTAVLEELSDENMHIDTGVTIKGSGVLEMKSFAQTITSLSGTGQVSLADPSSRLAVGSNGPGTFFGSLTGRGTLSHIGHGSLTLKGTAQSTVKVTAYLGAVIFDFFPGSQIPGTITVGSGSASSHSTLRLADDNQLPSSGTIIVNRDGLLDINGKKASAGTLSVNSGTVDIGDGELNLLSSLTINGGSITGPVNGTLIPPANVAAAAAGIEPAEIGSRVNLRNNPVFTVAPGHEPALVVSGIIGDDASGSGGFQKNGAGTMRITGFGSNTNTGMVSVNHGLLEMGKTVGPAIATALTVGTPAGPPGSAIVRSLGSLQLPSGGPITVHAGGLLDLNGYTEVCGSLHGTGKVIIPGSNQRLTIGAGHPYFSDFSGVISGTGGLEKIGVSSLTLEGINTYTGATVVSAGSMIINGTLTTSSTTVKAGAWLQGTGTTGPLGGAGGILPGSGPDPGTLSVSGPVDLTTSGGGKLAIRVNDSAPQKNDRLRVSGDLKLTGASLQPYFFGTFSPSTYIIATYGDFGGTLTGTFASAPAGCSIDYAHHDGTSSRNIALTVQNPYQFWVSSFGLDPAVAGTAGADPDKDGLPNGIEFVLNSSPADRSPALVRPTVAVIGPNMILSYRRWQSATYVNPVVQIATDLTGPWTDATGGTGVAADFYGPGLDKVAVTVSRMNRPRLFCRLKVTIP